MTQYATVTDLMARVDANLLGDWASDSKLQVAAGDLATNANLVQAVADASADIDAAVRVGNRYTPAQMAALEESSVQLLKRLCCDQALIYLKRRRGKFSDKDKPYADEVAARMKMLRDGENYLMLSADSESKASTPVIAGPCLIPIGPPGPLVTLRSAVKNYYPEIAGRYPNGNPSGGGNCGCQ